MKLLLAAIAALSLTIPALALAADNGRGGGRFGGTGQAQAGPGQNGGGNFGRGGGRGGNFGAGGNFGRGGNNAAVNPGGGRGNFGAGGNFGRGGNNGAINPGGGRGNFGAGGNFGRGGNNGAINPGAGRGGAWANGFGRGGNQAGPQYGGRGPQYDRDDRFGRDFRRPGPSQRYFTYRGRNFAQYRTAPFYYPRGYNYRRWYSGNVLPSLFLSTQFFFDDFYSIGLQPPPPGYRWVRYGPDALLVQLFSGRVVDVVYGVFYW